MSYSIIFNGTDINLPNYNFNIAGKIEEVEISNSSNTKKFRDKCKKMYEFETELIGKDKLTEVIGKFDDCDPNDINILYLSIVACYNQPLAEYNSEKATSKLNTPEIEKLSEVLKSLEGLASLNILNNGR